MPLIFEEVKLNRGYGIDLLIENKFVIEVKSVEALNDGIIRVINGTLSS